MLGKLQLENLLMELGASNIKVNSKQTEIQANCPFAPYYHKNGTDVHPSFSINILTNMWICFACGFKGGNVVTLLRKLSKFRDVRDLLRKYSDFESTMLVSELLELIQRFANQLREEVQNYKFNIWDASVLETYQGKIPQYVITRIGHEVPLEDVLDVASLFELGYDEKNRTLLIPIRDNSNMLVGVSRRFLEVGEYKDLFSWPKGEYLYGEQFFDTSNDSVYIVEGYFDVWRMYVLGYTNVYAVMGCRISDRQARKIATFARNVYIIPDGDESGYKLFESAEKQLLPLGASVFTNKPLDKDPSQYTKKELEDYIANAKRLVKFLRSY